MSPLVASSIALAVVLAIMLVELGVSRANERTLRGRGAVEAPDAVYRVMQWAYPGSFVAMAVEGSLRDTAPGGAVWWGAALFVLAKLLKAWAITSLGDRWTYKVLVEPGRPLVTGGPYMLIRHPNYLAVIGELVAMALMTGARLAGPTMTVFFAALLWRRIADEERALQSPAAEA
jgi:methyltransferase